MCRRFSSDVAVGTVPRQETGDDTRFLAQQVDFVYDRTMAASVTVTAAGGILERQGSNGSEIAVVHRRRYRHVDGSKGDWVLPKGKIECGESVEAAALREVAEETGYAGRIVGPSFTVEYRVGNKAKVVHFIRMVTTAVAGAIDESEVEAVCWLTPARAIARLKYPNERQIVARIFTPEPGEES